MDFVLYFINTVFQLLTLAIVARILMSWFQVRGHGGIFGFIDNLTQPILRVAQRITPRTGMVDFSPLVALIGLDLLNALLIRIVVSVPL